MGLSWATPLYLFAIYGFISFLNRPNNDGEGKRFYWSPIESIGVTLFIYFIAQIVGSILASIFPMLFGWNQDKIYDWLGNDAIGQFLLMFLISAISLSLLFLFLRRRQAPIKVIGLNRKPMLKDIGYALLALVGYFIAYIAIANLVKLAIPAINLEQEQQLGFDNVSNLQLPLVFISLVILPPIVEEILTRGFLYTGLKKGLPHIPAMVITSSIFAIAHLQAGSGAPLLWVAAIDTFVLSMFLIVLRDKTDSLWSPMLLHGLKNFIAFLSIFVFSVVK